MTPFLHDEQNPFARTSAWPTMPQAPLRLARARTVLGMGMPEAEPEAPPPPLPPIVMAPRRRREPRLTPLVAAGAVGAGGLLTLFLLIGVGPDPRPEAATAARPSALAVGELVGQTGTPATAPKP